ncbi:MAG: DUF1735 domain-containing protein [Chitinophagales bacterium]
MKLKFFVTILSAAVLLSSCLKSKDTYGITNDKGSIVVEIGDNSYYGPGNGAIKVTGLNSSPSTETITAITLRYYATRSLKPANAIHVKLVVNNPATTAIINNNGLTLMPANTYTLPNVEFDIPKGDFEGSVTVPITINKANFNFALVYGLGFSISTVSEGVISTLATDIVLSVQIKNAYDADYTTTGWFFHPTAPRALGPVTKHITTRGLVRSEAQLGDLGGFNYQFDVSGSNCINWGAVGSMPSPANGGGSGFMTLDNPGNVDYSTSAPNACGVAPYNIATFNNTYTAATSTFMMHYGYIATVPGGAQSAYTRQVYEKWVRQ